MGSFQNIFKELRIASGMTQTETAEKLGISRSTIGMYETGAREPDFETLEQIADFFAGQNKDCSRQRGGAVLSE